MLECFWLLLQLILEICTKYLNTWGQVWLSFALGLQLQQAQHKQWSIHIGVLAKAGAWEQDVNKGEQVVLQLKQEVDKTALCISIWIFSHARLNQIQTNPK